MAGGGGQGEGNKDGVNLAGASLSVERGAEWPETAVAEVFADAQSVADGAHQGPYGLGPNGDHRGVAGVANAAESAAGTGLGGRGEAAMGFCHFAVFLRRDCLRGSWGARWRAGDVHWYHQCGALPSA